MTAVKTNVYVDGFNLYYGCLKDSPYKWLDLRELCRQLFPDNKIHRIRYFTALVRSSPNDPTKRQRQQTYIRALETLPEVTVHYGSFMQKPVWMPLVNPTRRKRTAHVLRMEEKGSDVNLATLLLADAFRSDFEAAVVISNDSDLMLPIKIVSTELNLPVGIVNPHERFSVELRKVATFLKQLRKGALGRSQFAPTLTDGAGTLTKPASVLSR